MRLRINFLHMESDPETPQLRERLKNAFPFLGDDMVKTGGIGEFIAQGRDLLSSRRPSAWPKPAGRPKSTR